VPATGRVVEFNGMSIARMRDAKFVVDDFYFDACGVMRRLGLMPSLKATTGRAVRVVLRVVVLGKKFAAGVAAGPLLSTIAKRHKTRAS
jgi:hypothetical protein